jgi:hypothetical protein
MSTVAKAERFTLRPGEWCAAEFIGDEFANECRSYSPIRIESVKPSHSGKRLFKLSFFHANYPQGVQEKLYTLQTIERGEHFIMARSMNHTPTRLLLIYTITWEWLRLHFRIEQPSGGDDIARWLSTHA